MIDLDKPTPEWTSEAVVKRLQERVASGQPTSVQVFVTDAVKSAELQSKAQEIVADTRAQLGLPPEAVQLGKIYPVAKSFSLTSTKPQVFEALAKRAEVKTLLESEQADIFPKPVNRRTVP
jgi:hypothetical protein